MDKLIVYKITNGINGKLYFGITKVGINKRWIQHKCNSTRKSYHLYRAILKYGIKNFKIEIVELCKTELEMYNLEKKLIYEYNTTDNKFGYNNSMGGESSTKGSKRTVEQRKKISESQRGRKRKPFSEETILKMRKTAKGRDMSKAVEYSANKRRGKTAHNIVSVMCNGIIYPSLTQASKETGMSVSAIHNNLKGLSKSTKHGIWHYAETN